MAIHCGCGLGWALVLVGLIWGLLTFLPNIANRLADGTPAPAGSTWVKFTLPDGSAYALFPGAVTSAALPNGVMSHTSVVNGTIFALSDKSPVEVSEDFLEKMAKPAGATGLPEDENTVSLQTINGNRCLRKTLMKNGEVTNATVTFIHTNEKAHDHPRGLLIFDTDQHG